MIIRSVNQILAEAQQKQKAKLGKTQSQKQPLLVVQTSAGLLIDVTIPQEVEDKLAAAEYLPAYFLSSFTITDYLLAPVYENNLRKRMGEAKARDMVNRLKIYLDTLKGKSLMDQSKKVNSLVLD
jgi:hypothetical protein